MDYPEPTSRKFPPVTDDPQTQNTKMKTTIVILISALFLPIGLSASTPEPSPSPIVQCGDDNLKNALADMVRSTTATLQQAKTFVVEQSPAVFQQYLAWQVFNNKIWAWVTGIAAGIVFLFGIGVMIACWDDDGMGVGAFFITLSLFIFFAVTLSSVMANYKIKIAPQVYLLEYAKSLTK